MAKNHPVIHICPPSGGGVYDYAELITRNTPNAQLMPLSQQTKINVPEGVNCIIHYSGYGYAKRGAPEWLISWLKTQRPRINKLGIWFHEIYATGSPWSSAFWLSPVQRNIARRLAESSDFWITNRDKSADWLSHHADKIPHATLPVFSNVGESTIYPTERQPKIIIFGGAALRSETYRAAGKELFTWADSKKLEIHDIGPKISDPSISFLLKQNHVMEHGRLEKDVVNQHISSSMFGVVRYPKSHISKSGVFASYCAHGTCPVVISEKYEMSHGLVANEHYLAGIEAAREHYASSKKIGSSAWEWYQQHNINKHIKTLDSILCPEIL